MVSIYSPADSLHRLVKQAIDSGAARSIDEAEALFRGYRIAFSYEAEYQTAADQIALLTAVALAKRVFLGGVEVSGPMNVPLLAPLPLGETLGDAVVALGGRGAEKIDASLPLITIGGSPREPRANPFHIRTVYAGWRGGAVPAHWSEIAPATSGAMPLAAMLAAGFAISEAFFFIRGESHVAGRRSVGLSLWKTDTTSDWFHSDDNAPSLELLPSKLWLVGLGHLGQAFLWALSILPFPHNGLDLVLQDCDVVTPSTESTSILSEHHMVGVKKTRAMASWAERCGFGVTLCERRLDASTRRQFDEPSIAFCGLDNALGRRALDDIGFSLVVEAGLGRGHLDFRKLRIHTLPASRPSSEIWKERASTTNAPTQPAYGELLAKGLLDQCGVTLLANKAVGAPFVGCVASALAVSEVLRMLHGGGLNQMVDIDLDGVDQRTVIPQQRDFGNINPGYVPAKKGG